MLNGWGSLRRSAIMLDATVLSVKAEAVGPSIVILDWSFVVTEILFPTVAPFTILPSIIIIFVPTGTDMGEVTV